MVKAELRNMLSDANWCKVDRTMMGIYPNHGFRNIVKKQLAVAVIRSKNGMDYPLNVVALMRLRAAELRENSQGYIVLFDEDDDGRWSYVNHDTAGNVELAVKCVNPNKGKDNMGDYWWLNAELKLAARLRLNYPASLAAPF